MSTLGKIPMIESVKYLQLMPEALLPEIMAWVPFRAIVIVDAAVSTEWQSSVSQWLVKSGCLYMMAWGVNCSSWDDSVDIANIEQFNFGEIPENNFVMTTWHNDEPLEEVFWFSKNCAFHPMVEIERTILLHISTNSGEGEIMKVFVGARLKMQKLLVLPQVSQS